MKLKIKPSAKIPRRYLLLEANSKEDVEKTILEHIGILGWARSAPLFIGKSKLGNMKNKLILAVHRKELSNVRAAFELSNERIKIIRVSGTLKGLEKK